MRIDAAFTAAPIKNASRRALPRQAELSINAHVRQRKKDGKVSCSASAFMFVLFLCLTRATPSVCPTNGDDDIELDHFTATQGAVSSSVTVDEFDESHLHDASGGWTATASLWAVVLACAVWNPLSFGLTFLTTNILLELWPRDFKGRWHGNWRETVTAFSLLFVGAESAGGVDDSLGMPVGDIVFAAAAVGAALAVRKKRPARPARVFASPRAVGEASHGEGEWEFLHSRGIVTILLTQTFTRVQCVGCR